MLSPNPPFVLCKSLRAARLLRRWSRSNYLQVDGDSDPIPYLGYRDHLSGPGRQNEVDDALEMAEQTEV
jgi:hypothetical protein